MFYKTCPWVHAHLWPRLEERQVLRAAQNHPRAAARQIEAGESRPADAHASASGGSREVVEACGARLLQLSRCTRQSRQSSQFSVRDTQTLAACDSTSQPEEPEYVGALRTHRGAVASRAHGSSSISPCAL